MAWRVFVVDRYPLMRAGLQAVLAGSAEFRLESETDDSAEALRLTKLMRPDLVLMDLGVGAWDRVSAAEKVLRACPEAKLVFFAATEDEEVLAEAMRIGAHALIARQASAPELLEALRMVAEGGSYVDPRISVRLVDWIRGTGAAQRPAAVRISTLSPRELQIMELVAQGKSSRQIALELELTHETVRSYRKAMMKKLGVSNAASLTRVALTRAKARQTSAGGE